jgi:glycosyltransferase involved in cell wall biosynthesis
VNRFRPGALSRFDEEFDNDGVFMHSDKLRILLLNTQMEAAGAQKALLTLARGLQARNHIVQVVTMYDKADFVPRFARDYGVDIIDLHMKRPGRCNALWNFVDVMQGLRHLYCLARRERFDVLQTFSHYSNIVGPLIARIAGVPVCVSSQRMSLQGAPTWLLWLDRMVANSPLVATMVTVSEGTRRFSVDVQKIRPDKLVTIHNSINPEVFMALPSERLTSVRAGLRLPEESVIVTTVARLHPQKGHHFLIQAIPSIIERVPETHFLFVGGGELRESLETLVQNQELSDVVHFLGVRHDIPELLALSDVFVLPSLWEGLPNSLLEAMAAELPVVATAVDGTPEVVKADETGFLIPPADVDALVEAICRLLEEPNLRRRLGRAGRSRVVQSFSEEENITSFLRIYIKLLEETQ